jgi:hypothetical protein
LALLAGQWPLLASVLSAHLAPLRLGIGVFVSALLMETLFVRYRRFPFASCYVPSAELKSRGLAYVAALLGVSFTLAWIERFTSTAQAGYPLLVATLIGLTTLVTAFDRASRRPAAPLDLDEAPPLPTQRLDLAS